MKRFYRGALFAPFSAPLCFYVGAFFFQFANGRLGDDLSDWFITGPIIVFGWGLLIGYPAMFLFGLPYVYWLLYKDMLSIKYVYSGAIFFGALVSIVFTWIIESEISFIVIIVFSCLSLVTAYTFCRIEEITSTSKK